MKRLALPLLTLACLPLLTACPGNDTTGNEEVGETGTDTGTDSSTTDDPSTTTDSTSTDDDVGTTEESTTDDPTTEESTTDDPTTETTDDTTEESTTGGPSEAMLRVLHLGLEAPAVDVFLDDALDPAVAGLEFQSGTDYLVVPAGIHSIKVAPAGAGPDMAVLTVDALELLEGVKYSAVAYDYLANLSALALVDDDEGIDPANTRLQVSHTAPDVGQVDVWAMTDPPMMLLENVDFGATASIDIPAGAVDVGIDANDDMVPDLIYSVPDLGGGTFVDVYAVNEAGGSPVFLLAHLPDGTTARLDANCGNGVIDAFETCDGDDLGGQTCIDLGFSGGELSCSPACALVEDNCTDTQIFNACVQPNSVIPALGQGTASVINVPDMGTVLDVDVSILGTHTYVGDVTWTLTKGNLNDVVINRPLNGGGGCANDNWDVDLDDESAGGSVQGQCSVNPPAVGGNRTPNSPLSVFDGAQVSGDWSMRPNDVAAGDAGVFQEWCITITYE